VEEVGTAADLSAVQGAAGRRWFLLILRPLALHRLTLYRLVLLQILAEVEEVGVVGEAVDHLEADEVGIEGVCVVVVARRR